MHAPLIIQQGNRKAIVEGESVTLLKTHSKRPDTGVWPTTAIQNGEARLYAAMAWVTKAFIEIPGVKQ
jgi:hypothetical protein